MTNGKPLTVASTLPGVECCEY